MASGLAMRRINRPDTWLHRPAEQNSDNPCQTGAVHTWPIADMRGSFAFMTNTSFGLIVGALFSQIDATRPSWANAAAPTSRDPINLNPHVDATIEYRSVELC